MSTPFQSGNIVPMVSNTGSGSLRGSPYFSPVAITTSPKSTEINNSEIPPLQLDEFKRCWICFGEDTDSQGHWIKPCHCSLISHEECLLAWINENQKGELHKKVYCPQCNQVYQLSEPPSFLVDLFTRIDSIIQSTVPYITVVGLTGSVLVTSTTYGAYAVLTVCGSEEGERLLGSPNPWGWRVWLGLPLIPWILIGSRSTYLDSIMPLLPILVLGNDQLKFSYPPSPSLVLSILPWVRLIYNSAWKYFFGPMENRWKEQLRNQLQVQDTSATRNNEEDLVQEMDRGVLEIEWEVNLGNPTQTRLINRRSHNDAAAYALGERNDYARTIVGALLLPAISSVAGNILGYFPMIRNRWLPDTFLRSIVGGCFFIFLKDLTNLIYKYHLIRRLRKRNIHSVRPVN